MNETKDELLAKETPEVSVNAQQGISETVSRSEQEETYEQKKDKENPAVAETDSVQEHSADESNLEKDSALNRGATESSLKAVEESKEETMGDFDIVSLRPGQIVKGKIIRVTDEELYVNVGYKSDGVVSLEDILLEEDKPLTEVFHEGDDIEVEVLKVNDGEGNVILSHKNIVKRRVWKKIEEAYKNEEEISGTGKEVVKGGLLASIKGYSAFVPASQLSLHYVEDLSTFVGETLRLRILEIDKRRNRVVASQKVILEAEEAGKREKLWASLKEGQTIKGEVKRLTNFGAFVDIGGIDGLIHISDLSWGHIKSPKQVVTEGQEVEVLVLSVDKDNNRISLGYKQTLPHPWDNIEEKYPVGQIFQGKIVRITNFGAFVELEPGVDGLVHISQISDKRINKVEDVLKIGEMTYVKVLNVKPEEQRISLSIKEAVEKQEKKSEKKLEKKENLYEKEDMTFSLGDFFPNQNEN